jgi:GT2 family glycosyltransferase
MESPKSTSVSAIIPTKDRPADLAAIVCSILRQTVLPQQLIIVDQSLGSDSQCRIEKLFCELTVLKRIDLRYIRDVKLSGLAAARNRALDAADGEVCLFLDDDVCLEPNFVEELLNVYDHYPEATGVSGIVTNYEPPSWRFRTWSGIFVKDPFHDDRQIVYWKARRFRHLHGIRVTRLGGGLMSFRTAAIRGRRFDDNLRGVSDGEDVDFCARLGPNTTLIIAPRARLVHKNSPIGRAQDHWLRRFARANHYLYHRNWERGFRNRLAFVWLNIGLGLVALLASARRASLAPWRALRIGAHEGSMVGRPWPLIDGNAPQATTGRARFGWRL